MIIMMIIKKLPVEANKEIKTLYDWSPCCRSFAERNNGLINVPRLAPAMRVTSQNYLVIIFCKMEHLQTVTNQKYHPTSIMM